MLGFKNLLLNNFQITEENWKIIRRYFQHAAVRKEEFYIKEGTVCRNIAYIAEGVMRYLYYKENGDDVTCFFMSENDCVTDPDSFETQKPSKLNLQAVTNCKIIAMSYESCLELKKQFPGFIELNAAITKKTMTNLLNQRTVLMKEKAEAKYSYFMKNYPRILQRAPLGMIASYLGITQQSLSRLRKI